MSTELFKDNTYTTHIICYGEYVVISVFWGEGKIDSITSGHGPGRKMQTLYEVVEVSFLWSFGTPPPYFEFLFLLVMETIAILQNSFDSNLSWMRPVGSKLASM